MNSYIRPLDLNERYRKVEAMIASLADRTDFAAELERNSLDAHLSDLKKQLNCSEAVKSYKEVIQLRLIGAKVADGSAPASIFSGVLKNFTEMVHRAGHLLASGNDSQKVSKFIIENFDIRIANILPGSSKMVLTASSKGDLGGSLTKEAIENIFNMLHSIDDDDENFVNSVSKAGINSLNKLNSIVSLLEKEKIEVDFTWSDPDKGINIYKARYEQYDKLKSLMKKFDIRKNYSEDISGSLTMLDKEGSLNVENISGHKYTVYFLNEQLSEVREACNFMGNVKLRINTLVIGSTQSNSKKYKHFLEKILN